MNPAVQKLSVRPLAVAVLTVKFCSVYYYSSLCTTMHGAEMDAVTRQNVRQEVVSA